MQYQKQLLIKKTHEIHAQIDELFDTIDTSITPKSLTLDVYGRIANEFAMNADIFIALKNEACFSCCVTLINILKACENRRNRKYIIIMKEIMSSIYDLRANGF